MRPDPIRSAAVLGAGTMGAQIAAHLANAGIPVVLLDQTADLARRGLERLKSVKPLPFFVPETSQLIRASGFDDLALVSSADWIIEAVIESLEVKQRLLAEVERHRSPGAAVSSNTSGLSLTEIAAGRSVEFRRHWLGTHFFNPPRYLRLVELIPTTSTDPSVTAALSAFIDHRLGKGVVLARDTPAFIANHLGMFGIIRLLHALASGTFSIEEIDDVTGPVLGRPKSATFRTIDIAGLDVLAAVAADLSHRLPRVEDRRQFELPPFVSQMIARGLIGEKAGQGFYKRVSAGGGEAKILTLDLTTLEYRDRAPVRLSELDAARGTSDVGARVRQLFLGPGRAGDLLRETLGPMLAYAARVAPDIAASIDDVDRAMRWGFGWELGPFETSDAIGVGPRRFRDAPLPPAGPGLLILQSARRAGRVVKHNAGASLVDLGDGVLCVEFHSKMNTIGGEIIAMIQAGVAEAAANFAALVVGSEEDQFSAGANLTLLLIEAQEGHWDEIDAMVRAFQGATMALKFCAVPVIAAPTGLAIGGGCEICLHADRVQASAETYIGLVEAGVGLIPAGGGTKEMLMRAVARAGGGDASAVVRSTFEAIGLGKVSTSAADARVLGYLRDVDGITMNRERVIADAKARALARVAEGYTPPRPAAAIPVGGADTLAVLSLGVHLARRAGRLSDHDALVGRKLAWILAGGDLPQRTTVTETYLLDLEREAFLSLCGERKTLERIGYTLKTAKTLRN